MLDATLLEHTAHGVECHPYEPALSLNHGLSAQTAQIDLPKKSLIAQEREPWQRAAFPVQPPEHRADQMVIVDESGTNLTRHYAWAPRGQRAYGSDPRHTPPNTTVIASLTTAGIGPSMIFSGATDHLAFCTYIEQVLAPSLQAGQLIAMDNLRAHKHPRVRELIEARLCYRTHMTSDQKPAY